MTTAANPAPTQPHTPTQAPVLAPYVPAEQVWKSYADWRASLKNRFRVKVGKHTQKEPLFDETGAPVIDRNPESRTFGKQVRVNRIYQAKTEHDVIETAKDLVAIFNSPGSEKFEWLHKDDHRASVPVPAPLPPHQAQAVQAPQQPPSAPQTAAHAQDTLDSMTVKELQTFAEAEELGLPDHLTRPNAKKEELLKVIRAKAPR